MDSAPPHTTPPASSSRSSVYGHEHGSHEANEELPSYDESSRAPAYQREPDRDPRSQLDGHALVFSLRQLSRKKQAFISMGPPMNVIRGSNRFTEVDSSLTLGHFDETIPYPWNTTSREFAIEHTTGAGMSRTKPDFVVTASDPQQRRQSMPSPPSRRRPSLFRMTSARAPSPDPADGRRGALINSTEGSAQTQAIASVRFARSGPLPWTPRATISYQKTWIDIFGHDGHQLNEHLTQEMQLDRASYGWAIKIFDRDYAWCIMTRPTRLSLLDLESEIVRATFVYSDMGSHALKDAEVGRLSVPLEALPGQEDGVRGRTGLRDGFMEMAVCSLCAAITHWKNEGKIFVNQSQFVTAGAGTTTVAGLA